MIQMIISREEFDSTPDVNIKTDRKVYMKNYLKKCREKHKEKIKVQVREYYDNHRDERGRYIVKYYKKNEEKIKLYNVKYRAEHKNELRILHNKYHQTPKGKSVRRKVSSRRRKLGFIPLNKPFDNCDAHHVDREHVIYMPHSLHRSIYHRLDQPETMVEINNQAMKFLEEK